MDLHLESPGNANYIRSLLEHGVRVGDQICDSAFIVSADALITDWPPQSMSDIRFEHFEPVISMRPEVVLLGTGSKHQFLEPRLTVALQQAGLGLEVMTTEAACRTFNVLVTEARRVVAAILPLDNWPTR